MPQEAYRRTDARFFYDVHLASPLGQRITSIVTREEIGDLNVFVSTQNVQKDQRPNLSSAMIMPSDGLV